MHLAARVTLGQVRRRESSTLRRIVGQALFKRGALLFTALALVVAIAPVGAGPALARVSWVQTISAKATGMAASAADGPLRVVGLGDSVPSGGACDCTPYVELAADELAAEQGVAASVNNAAVSGADSADVLVQLSDNDLRASVADADLVIIEVGANDVDASSASDPSCLSATTSPCYASQVSAMSDNLAKIVATVSSLQTSPTARIALVGYWNVFEDGAVGAAQGPTYVRGSAQATTAVNAAIARIATATKATYVDAWTPFKGASGARDDTDDLAADGDHPNAAGHQLLATAVVDSLAR